MSPDETLDTCRPTGPVDPAYLKEHVSRGFLYNHHRHWIGHTLGAASPRPGSVQMQTNDYLCLAGDRRIALAKAGHLLLHGHGDSISRIFAHHRKDNHRAFEQRVARLMGAQDAVLCMSGYNANTGLIQAFAPQDRPVYMDVKAHASLWEGVTSAKATPRPFRHNDPNHLERQIARYGPGLVVVDALYSTDGNICPLEDIVCVAERGECVIVVDETHSFGCHGDRGEGLTVALGLAERVHFRTVGLSKAVAARGGLVVGSARNMEFFRYEAWPMIFSTSVLGYEVAGFDKALDIVVSEPWRRRKLHRNHAYLRQGLDGAGYNVDACDSQIISIEAGLPEDVIAFREALFARGVYGSVFCPPATAKNRCLMRFTINCGLTRDDLDRVIAVCAEVRDQVGMHRWRSTRSRAGLAAQAGGGTPLAPQRARAA